MTENLENPNTPQPTAQPVKPFNQNLIIGLVIGLILVGALSFGAASLNIFENPDSKSSDESKTSNDSESNKNSEEPFCSKYGTFELNRKDLYDEIYYEEGVTSYIKAQGNITFNEDKPMFGVNAPNSGTGPFIITDNIEDDLRNIEQGDCVEVVYGSRGYDPQKVVFRVDLQD